MKSNHRLKKLEQARAQGIFVGLPERREDCVATANGVTHAPFEGVTFARADYETDENFWAAVERRKNDFGYEAVIWLPSDPRKL